MPVVGFAELHKHAAELEYGLAIVRVGTLAVARGVMESSAALDAPLLLAVDGDGLAAGLLPSVESLARQLPGPVALLGSRIRTADQATQAIRLGCNVLGLADDSGEAASEIGRIASDCGIELVGHEEIAGALIEIDDELQAETLAEAARSHASWAALEQAVADAASRHMSAVFDRLQASGKGIDALRACRPWRPVEHLIIYNTTTDETASAELAAEGRRVLDRIPGVRATWSGEAVTEKAAYRWCWLIRFAHPDVIDSYREHPDHVAYADKHFRPVAGDRVSIDYTLTGADEAG